MNPNYQNPRVQMQNINYGSNPAFSQQPPPYSMSYQNQSSINYQMNATASSLPNYEKNIDHPLSAPPPALPSHNLSQNTHSNPTTPLVGHNISSQPQNPVIADPKLMPMKNDPISILKNTLPDLRDSLNRLFIAFGQTTDFNISYDQQITSTPSIIGKDTLDKNLQETFSLIDLMEINMKTALDFHIVQQESSKYSPSSVTLLNRPTNVDSPYSQHDNALPSNSLAYQDYLYLVNNQVSMSKQIRESLLDCLKGLEIKPE